MSTVKGRHPFQADLRIQKNRFQTPYLCFLPPPLYSCLRQSLYPKSFHTTNTKALPLYFFVLYLSDSSYICAADSQFLSLHLQVHSLKYLSLKYLYDRCLQSFHRPFLCSCNHCLYEVNQYTYNIFFLLSYPLTDILKGRLFHSQHLQTPRQT